MSFNQDVDKQFRQQQGNKLVFQHRSIHRGEVQKRKATVTNFRATSQKPRGKNAGSLAVGDGDELAQKIGRSWVVYTVGREIGHRHMRGGAGNQRSRKHRRAGVGKHKGRIQTKGRKWRTQQA